MSIKNNLVSIMSVVQNYRLYRSYSNQFKYYLKQLSIKNVPVSGESEYLKKWSVFTPHVWNLILIVYLVILWGLMLTLYLKILVILILRMY